MTQTTFCLNEAARQAELNPDAWIAAPQQGHLGYMTLVSRTAWLSYSSRMPLYPPVTMRKVALVKLTEGW